jgi:hypothetical protein
MNDLNGTPSAVVLEIKIRLWGIVVETTAEIGHECPDYRREHDCDRNQEHNANNRTHGSVWHNGRVQ